MANDDYFILAYKILSYFYDCLKGKKKLDFEYLQPMTKDFPIEEGYFDYIIEKLYTEGYLEGVMLLSVTGCPHSKIKYTEAMRITPKGIEYLMENSTMSKAKDFLKTIKEITPGL